MATDKKITALDTVTVAVSDGYYAPVAKSALNKKLLLGSAAGHDHGDYATAAQGAKADAAKAVTDTVGNIITHAVAEFATAAQGTKADTALQAADEGYSAGKLRIAPSGLLVPVVASFGTAINVASSTFTNKNYGILADLTPDIAVTTKFIGKTQAVVVGDWSITMGVKMDVTADNGLMFGILLHDGTKGCLFGLKANIGGGVLYALSNIVAWDATVAADLNQSNTEHTTIYNQIARSQPMFLRIVKSGTTRNFQTSVTGQTFTTIYSQSTALTETTVGFGGRNDTPNSALGTKNTAYIFHWENVLAASKTDIDFPPY